MNGQVVDRCVGLEPEPLRNTGAGGVESHVVIGEPVRDEVGTERRPVDAP